MKKFVLRHWRGNGQIIPDIMKDIYYDYPKNSMNRNARKYNLSECIVQVISEQDYKIKVLEMWGQESLDKKIKQLKLKPLT